MSANGRSAGAQREALCRKAEFRLDGIHYLNCAYMAPLSRRVERAGLRGLRRKRVPTDLRPRHFFKHADKVRERFARLLRADAPERVAVLPSVSYGMAVIARNTAVRPGQNVVIPADQMPSNVYVWRRFCRERGIELRTVGAGGSTGASGAPPSEAVLEAIDSATALVSIGHVHWVDGTLFDLAEIARKVRAAGGALVVDGTQSLGALPLDVGALEPDAVISAGYKWLLGPYSLAVGYFGPRYLGGEPLEENWLNRHGSHDFTRLTDYQDDYRPGAARYDVGEGSNFILAPMLAAALEQLLEWNVADISAYCGALTRRIVAGVRELGLPVPDERRRAPHYLGIELPVELPPRELERALRARNVVVSVRGGLLRVTPNIYNDASDVDALLAALRESRCVTSGSLGSGVARG